MCDIITSIKGIKYVLHKDHSISKYEGDNNVCCGMISNKPNIFIINPIVGVLHLSDTVSYTTSKKGVIKKRFSSFLHMFPTMYVKTKKTILQSDQYVVINIDGVEDGKFIGTVLSYICDTSDVFTNNELIKAITTSHWSMKLNKEFAKTIVDITPDRTDMTHIDNIYSVDPIGCVDIDDAIHVTKCDDGTFEIGIHIADASSYVEQGSVFDTELAKRCQTIYSTEKVIHMIPEEISLFHMSLRERLIKRAFSVIVKCDTDINILNVELKKTIVVVKRNLSYELAQEYANSNNNDNIHIKLMYEVGQILKHKYFSKSFDGRDEYDAHQMVEIYMILTNKVVAEHLAQYDGTNVLLRKHNETNHNDPSKDLLSVPPNVLNISKLIQMNSAEYVVGTTGCAHFGLNLDHYTQFTSPMRRYADILVHRQLYASLKHNTLVVPTNVDIFRLNMYNKIYRHAQQYADLINKMSTCGTLITNAYIAGIINDDIPIVKLYIPTIDSVQDVKLCGYNDLKLFDVILEDSMINIKNKLTLNILTIEMFQQVKIRIATSIASILRTHIDIIDPCVNNIFV
jgi:exoribonuclease R